MRRMRLVLAVAAVMAAIVALAGPSVANSTQPKQESYSDRVEAQQYFVRPPSALNPVGTACSVGWKMDFHRLEGIPSLRKKAGECYSPGP